MTKSQTKSFIVHLNDLSKFSGFLGEIDRVDREDLITDSDRKTMISISRDGDEGGKEIRGHHF